MVFRGHQQHAPMRGCSLSWSMCWVLSLALVGGVHPARHPRYVDDRIRGNSAQRGSSHHSGLSYDLDDGLDSDIYLAPDITQEIDEGLEYPVEPGIIPRGLSLNSSPEQEQSVNSQANLFRMLQVFPSVVGTGYFVEAKRGMQTKGFQKEYDDITDEDLVGRPQVAKFVSLDLPKKKRGSFRDYWYPGPTAAPRTPATTKKAYPRSCLFYLKICKS